MTGSSANTFNVDDYATIKYDAMGMEQWVARYDGSGGGDEAFGLAVDHAGNVYVTGESGAVDYVTVKYDAVGTQLWTTSYTGREDSRDEPVAIGVDGAGNVYVTGRSFATRSTADIVTVKYDAVGIEQWQQSYDSPGNSNEGAIDLGVDADGNVYVLGWSQDPDTGEREYSPVSGSWLQPST